MTVLSLLMLTACVFEPAASETVTIRTVEHLGDQYTVVTVPLGTEADIRLYGGRSGGSTFTDAITVAESEHRQTIVLMNGGMFGQDHGPVGLFVANGEARHTLNLRDGDGNFHLKPNGVFWLDTRGIAHVTVSEGFDADRSPVMFATQSGPMLLIDGTVHPEFRPDSTNKLVRNAVGVSSNGDTVHLVISQGAVRFHDLATLFRDKLACEDALFLDATVSKLWTDGDVPTSNFGAIIAVTRGTPR